MSANVRWVYACAWTRQGFAYRKVFSKQSDAFDYAEAAVKDGYDPELYVFRQTFDTATGEWVSRRNPRR